MKKAFRVFALASVILLSAILFCLSASAESENGYIYTVTENTATVTGIEESVSGDITIPSSLGGYTVTALGERIFQSVSGITSVVIPDTLETIGAGCFNYCADLQSVVIGDGVQTIGTGAFENCPNLTSVTVGDGVKTFGNRAFALCRKLTAIRIPASTEAIGNSAFAMCSALVQADFEEGNLISIGESAFSDCTKLEAVQLYDGIESIGDKAFYCCSSIETLTVPGSLISTDYYSFSGCTGLTELVLEEGIEVVGMSSFMDCSSLTEISFPSTLTKIETYGFSGCSSLTELDLSEYEYIEEIGYGAFLNCTNLEDIALPDYALYLCDNTFGNTRCQNNDENWIDGAFIIGNHFIEYYYLSVPEKYSRYIIPDGIKTLAQNSFSNLYYVSTLVIPSSVEIIGKDPFYEANSLKTVCYTSDETAWNEIYTVEDDEFDNQEIVFNYVICYHESLTEDSGTQSSCESVGYTEGTFCNDCKEWLEGHETIPSAGGHSGGTATCNSKAVCTVCKSEYGSFDKDNHNSIITLEATEATCTAAGKTAGKKCTSCNTVTVTQSNISPKGHKLTTLSAVAATCTKTGKTEGKKCTVCGTVTVEQQETEKKAHTYKTALSKATFKDNGKKTTECTVCGHISESETIYKIKSVTLSPTKYTCNGKVKTPSVTVKDSMGNTLEKNRDYTVKYSNGRKNPGKYTVTVTFINNYEGTKKLTFIIKPSRVTLSKLTSASGSAVLNWKTVSGVSGYEVIYSASNKFKASKTATVNKASRKKLTIKKLTKGKKYYFKVRAFKTVNGKKIYGAWSSVKSVKIK